jgi:uncharacterized protein YaaW (UPF0174 family)
MSVFTDMVNSVETWFNTNPVGKMIEDDIKLAIKELETVGIQQLENIVKVVGVTVLQSLVTTGGNTPAAVAAAIEAGIAAAVPAFKAAGTDITTKTVTTLVGTVVNQLGAVAPSVAAQKVATPSA